MANNLLIAYVFVFMYSCAICGRAMLERMKERRRALQDTQESVQTLDETGKPSETSSGSTWVGVTYDLLAMATYS